MPVFLTTLVPPSLNGTVWWVLQLQLVVSLLLKVSPKPTLLVSRPSRLGLMQSARAQPVARVVLEEHRPLGRRGLGAQVAVDVVVVIPGAHIRVDQLGLTPQAVVVGVDHVAELIGAGVELVERGVGIVGVGVGGPAARETPPAAEAIQPTVPGQLITLGLLLVVFVHSAHIQDRDGACDVSQRLSELLTRLKLVWADGGYAGQLVDLVRSWWRYTLEIVKRTDDMEGFVVLPKRWIVERTLAWLCRNRRLSKDDERLPSSSETVVSLASIRMMIRRLAKAA